ncbi:MAG: hypothetical protein FWD87_10455 [Spirochaetaceae bacterium]|nr:hypothetical protein [Spirochaetaceae bacterium]
MNSGMLYSLIPKPINIQNSVFSGKLLIDGNIIDNLLLFRFQFDTPENVSPVCIQLEVLQKIYQYFCGIKDFTNPVVKSKVIKPEFCLKNTIKILKVEPLISFCV